jgi:hypothetical protein
MAYTSSDGKYDTTITPLFPSNDSSSAQEGMDALLASAFGARAVASNLTPSERTVRVQRRRNRVIVDEDEEAKKKEEEAKKKKREDEAKKAEEEERRMKIEGKEEEEEEEEEPEEHWEQSEGETDPETEVEEEEAEEGEEEDEEPVDINPVAERVGVSSFLVRKMMHSVTQVKKDVRKKNKETVNLALYLFRLRANHLCIRPRTFPDFPGQLCEKPIDESGFCSDHRGGSIRATQIATKRKAETDALEAIPNRGPVLEALLKKRKKQEEAVLNKNKVNALTRNMAGFSI